MNASVVIVQPYIPAYRVTFFKTLRSRLAESEVDCHVVAGTPQGDQARRADAVHADWATKIHQSKFYLGGRSFGLPLRSVPWETADAVILGLEGSSLPVYQALIRKARGGLRVGLWGHVAPYVNGGNKLDLCLERMQMRVADRVFAYTPGGQLYASEMGISESKITTVMNTVDTVRLETELRTAQKIGALELARSYGLDSAKTVCFLGGIDKSKRIDFFAHALDHLWQKDASIKILIGGKGPDSHLFKEAYARGQAIELGYVDDRKKATVLAASKAVCMPGRIGLIAVDALVARKPIITTNWKFHAPEADYLVEGVSKYTAGDSPESYAQKVVDFLRISKGISLKPDQWTYPTLTNMVENFANGVEKMIDR